MTTSNLVSEGGGEVFPPAARRLQSLTLGKMTTLPALLLLALVAPLFAAEEQFVARIAPQPRLRLDPVSRTAVTASPGEATRAPQAPIVAMEKFIVREKGFVEKEPADQDVAQGPFSLFGGGYLATREIGRSQLQIGACPWLPKADVMWKDQKFKPQKTRVDLNFVRLRW